MIYLQLSKRFLEQKSEEEELQFSVEECKRKYEKAKGRYLDLLEQEQELEQKNQQCQERQEETKKALEEGISRKRLLSWALRILICSCMVS